MKYKKISTYSYNLHIIKTNKFKTVTVQVNFKRKLNKEEITYRNMIVNMLCESTSTYPSKRLMTIGPNPSSLNNTFPHPMTIISES